LLKPSIHALDDFSAHRLTTSCTGWTYR